MTLEITTHKNVLVHILKDIYSDTQLGPILGFKGGAAAYLFYNLGRASHKVDLDEYNLLILQSSIINLRCWNQGIYGKKVRQQIRGYFKRINTPTSLRLLADYDKDWR